jgi:hypothetical protein
MQENNFIEKDDENCFINVLDSQNSKKYSYMTNEYDFGNEEEIVDEK